MIKMAENDFNSMQAQAIRYAQEMHRRANPTQQKPQSDLPPKQQTEVQAHESRNTREPQPLFSPLTNIINSIFGNILKDQDTVLILAMIILLASDGADKMLILALLYIIS